MSMAAKQFEDLGDRYFNRNGDGIELICCYEMREIPQLMETAEINSTMLGLQVSRHESHIAAFM